MTHIGHYHEARLLQIEDIDGQIQRLNAISRQRGEHGHWVCARVIPERPASLADDRSYTAIFFYLADFSTLIDKARLFRTEPQTAAQTPPAAGA
jgi:hypothetical protein